MVTFYSKCVQTLAPPPLPPHLDACCDGYSSTETDMIPAQVQDA